MLELLVEIAAWSSFAFAAVIFVIQVLAREAGYWIGRRSIRFYGKSHEGVGSIVAAVMGLLAFVLALTLSFANSRFTERRDGTLAEANAIGTAWLRAEAIGHPRGQAVARLLEDYTRLRIEFLRAPNDPAVLQQLNQRTSNLQNDIWGHVTAIVRERADPISNSLMTSLNETFDATTAERFADSFRIPPQLSWLLLGMSMTAMAAFGFQLGLKEAPLRIPALILTGLWTVVIFDILDIASPRLGTMRTSTLAYEWTLQGFSGGIRIPPAP
ncbi:hypothetical protein [Roseococcus sp. YIM B11640]|uniref:bestrophin-like domain n=1 Tax=Roseococcus sp. YIM B11640 TaxID=3133973 RepID=UPI003C7E55D3